MRLGDWLAMHRPGFEFFLLPILVLAALVVGLERAGRRRAIPWLLLGTWVVLCGAMLTMFGIARYRSNLPVLLMWTFVAAISTLIPLPLVQIGNVLARRARSPLVHGAGIFVAGWLIGVPLLLLATDLLIRFLRPFAGIGS